jgi:hypothetical protein
MFVYFVGSKILISIELGRQAGLVMPIPLGYLFFQGIRGTFAYHKLAKVNEQKSIVEK